MARRLCSAMSKRAAAFLRVGEDATPHRGGNADNVQNEGVARKAIRKIMKTKERQIDLQRSYMELRETPTPGVLHKESASC